ncbi:hypothetical protein [Kitasatospora sp. McL0602]|uniref:hypothetical protein n=1 Tax=Kitasatospora sp. McL0602 TaxID=3439530 RepID=UPI003F890955
MPHDDCPALPPSPEAEAGQDDQAEPDGLALEPAESGTTARLRAAVADLNRRSRWGVL